MNTQEIIDAFLKGNEVASISQNQRDWLLSVARREGKKITEGYGAVLYMDLAYYTIDNATHKTRGVGGLVGNKTISGRYNMRKLYRIKYNDTGIEECRSLSDLKYIDRETPHKYTIINPIQNAKKNTTRAGS